jgi:Transposase DDE domain
MVLLITAGQCHEQTMFEPLLERGAVKRAGRGRPRLRPDRVAGDKGYSSRKIRRYLRRRGIGVVIARQRRERRVRFDKAGPVRQGGLPQAPCSGAPGEPPEAVPPHRYPLRETGGQLPGNAHHRRYYPLVATLQTRPYWSAGDMAM